MKNNISADVSHLKLTWHNSMTWKQTESKLKCRALDVNRETLSAIFEVAREMETIEKKSRGNQILKGFLMATSFYEPSTRIRLSFESTMKWLGGEVLTPENAREFSSAAKGETHEGNY
ncbi:putative aspartate carbamoyltransferase [Helianthus anomalus]